MGAMRYDDEPAVMKELRKIKERISVRTGAMSREEEIAHSKRIMEAFEKETGIKLPRRVEYAKK